MRKLIVVAVVVILALTLVPAAFAADDGNTQPKFSTNSVYYPNSSVDVIGTTSGTGNVKGIRCNMSANGAVVNVYVNGGTAQTLTLSTGDTLWMPMNVRFTTSIRVQITNGANYQASSGECDVSWALD